MAAPAFNWTGFYIGVVGGYGWGDAEIEPGGLAAGAFGTARSKPDGWLAGGTVGSNFQQGNIVLGTEGEFYWSDISASATGGIANAGIPLAANYQNNWTGTFSTRLGVAFDTLLWYGKAGVAYGNNDYTMRFSDVGFSYNSTISETEVGWLVGGGVEWAFARNWSAKIEGTYIDYSQKNHDFARVDVGIGTLLPINADIRSNVSTIKFGVNYRFDWGKGPVTANY